MVNLMDSDAVGLAAVIEALNSLTEAVNDKMDLDVGNKGGGMQLIWSGTQTEYDALPETTKNQTASLFFILKE